MDAGISNNIECCRFNDARWKMRQESADLASDYEDKVKRMTEMKIEIEKAKNTEEKDKLIERERSKADKRANDIKQKEAELEATMTRVNELNSETERNKSTMEEMRITIESRNEEFSLYQKRAENIFGILSDIFRHAFRIRKKNIEIYELLYDDRPQIVNEADLETTKRENIPAKILEYMEDVDNNNGEIFDEIQSMKQVVQNLVVEKAKLQNHMHDLNEKVVDLSKRHDIKVEQLGKVTAKAFMLMAECDRQNVERMKAK